MENSELFSVTPFFFPPAVNRTRLWDILDSKGSKPTLASKTNLDKGIVTHCSLMPSYLQILPPKASLFSFHSQPLQEDNMLKNHDAEAQIYSEVAGNRLFHQ